MAIYSGKNARVQLAGQFLTASKWSINAHVEEKDISCFEAPYFTATFPDSKSADISIEGFWVGGNFKAEPPYFQEGQTCPLYIFPDWHNIRESRWYFPSVFISSLLVEAEVRGFVRYTIVLKNHFYPWFNPGNILSE